MNTSTLELTTRSPEQTEALGATLVSMLVPGSVVALYGDLASGKTCFVRGMASYFGEASHVHSPTFTLVNEYGEDPKLQHVDLYRLSGPAEVEDLGCTDFLYGTGICAVEWAERAAGLLPERHVEIRFEHAGDDLRRIVISDHGILPGTWAAALKEVIAFSS
ncbi:MAG: tRNA (adenosine(37)-N6)-threonylcarbamoyltransferase complex ATPase subunit type 1 TsaE [Candidatus Hydrogenedentes bacterium]|nr:tRNA (adenosine(37)-N6)-threonylcarbamoyltransferase complex ATPase subunit type 1 TsaE [Candidatus Hydrogenedentota bacterium]